MKLGVNIDHVATLRQARGTLYPDPVYAALQAEIAGADGITLHLREDRRHIQDRDVYELKEKLTAPMNLEMAVTEEMMTIAEKVVPENVCLVPEKREELTTEGGLNVIGSEKEIALACERLGAKGINVSLFIDPDQSQIEAAVACGAPTIELHTGCYADTSGAAQKEELQRLIMAATLAEQCGLRVNAGHGLHYQNVAPIVDIPQIYELNIGHSIIARAVLVGLDQAVKQMRELFRHSHS